MMALRQELTLITPELAQMFYENLAVNRKLRPNHVDYFVTEMLQGTFKTTHQGIAINTAGKTIDGQHRLAAIIKSGVSVMMFIAWDCDAVKAIDWPCDNGIPRTAADIMEVNRLESALVDAALTLYHGSKIKFSTSERLATYQFFKSSIESLKHACSVNRPGRTATAVKFPVLLQSMSEGVQIENQYRAFVLLDYDAMWPSVKALTRQLADVPVSRAREPQSHLMARVWQAFTPSRRNVTRIQLSDPDGQILEMRQSLQDLGYARTLELAGC